MSNMNIQYFKYGKIWAFAALFSVALIGTYVHKSFSSTWQQTSTLQPGKLVYPQPMKMNVPLEVPKNIVIPKGAKTIGFGTANWGDLPWFGDEFGKLLHCDKPCVLIPNVTEADGVMFCKTFLNFSEDYLNSRRSHEHPGQLWMVMTVESPLSSASYTKITTYKSRVNDVFNFADSYTPDADFSGVRSTGLYGKVVERTEEERQQLNSIGKSSYLEQKTGLVAGMIYNCDNSNTGRLEYIKELHKHVTADGHKMRVYGACFKEDGSFCEKDCKKCEATLGEEACKFSELGKKYKFYLSFENSLCWMYITEKFWENALQNDMIPIVNGGLSKEDYTKVAPPHSFIHVDDFDSPKKLAEYLIHLDSDDVAYNEYFKWRETHKLWNGLKTFEPPCPWDPNCHHVRYCDFCEILHDEQNFIRNHRKRVNFDAIYGLKDNCRLPDKQWVSDDVYRHRFALFQKDLEL